MNGLQGHQADGEGDYNQNKQDQGNEKKQKEQAAYTKKILLRLAGIMGLGGTMTVVYIFGTYLNSLSDFFFLLKDTMLYICMYITNCDFSS